MENIRKSFLRNNKSPGDLRKSNSSSYLLLSYDKKNESYKNEIQIFIKDIEDLSKNDADLWFKYKNIVLDDDLTLKFREFTLNHNGHSLLHLAAKNCRKKICEILIKDVKISIFLT